MNVASTLRRYGAPTTLLSAIGLDPAGEELAETCREMGIGIDFLHHSPDLPTDRYMAIEDLNGLVSAVADVHTLESSGEKILRPLSDGRLGTPTQPWEGMIVLDGNLTESLLAHIATSPVFARADLRVAPARPGKVERLRPLLTHPRLTLYANLPEARLLAGTSSENAATAATALIAGGVRRVLVTDGERECVDGLAGEPLMSERPPEVRVKRITGAAADPASAPALERYAREETPRVEEHKISTFTATGPHAVDPKPVRHRTATPPAPTAAPLVPPLQRTHQSAVVNEADPVVSNDKLIDFRQLFDYTGFLGRSLRRHPFIALGAFALVLGGTVSGAMLMP